MKNDVLLKRQNKIMALGIGILLLCITMLIIVYPVQAISIQEIKSYIFPSSGGSTVNNYYYSNVYYSNYTIAVQALTSSPTNNVLNYFGNTPSALGTTAGQNKIYFNKAGNITAVEIYQYSETAGTAEKYNLTIVKNGVRQDSLGFIKELSVSSNERIFNNYTLCLPVVKGDYIEFVFRNPLWVTNPLTTIVGGYFEVSP